MASTIGGPTKKQLPEREAQVLSLAAQGLTDKQIAGSLGISQETVGTYWRRILLRFGASSRTEVVAKLAEDEARERIESAEAQAEALQEEVAQRTSAHERESARRSILEALKDVSLDFIGGSASFGTTFRQVLSSVIRVTESEYGFVAELRFDDSGDIYLETRAIQSSCGVLGPTEFRDLNSLYGRVVKTESVVISNDTLNDRYASGLPDDHPRLSSFLGMPIFDGSRMVGVIGVANREGGYNFDLIDFVEPLTATCGRLISAYRADAAWKESEREIVASAHRLSVLMANLNSGVLFGDREGKVEFANQSFCDLFGLDCRSVELVGSDCKKNASAMSYLFSNPGGFCERVREITDLQQPVVGEQLDLRDGRTFSRDFIPIHADGELRGYLWHFRDITGKVQESRTLRAILDAVGEAVIVIDDGGIVRFWNQAASGVFGFSNEEASGHDLSELIIPETSRKTYRSGLRLLMTSRDSIASVGLEAMTKAKTPLYVEVKVTPITLNSSKLFAAFLRPSAGRSLA